MRRHDEAPRLPTLKGPHEIVETGMFGWAGFGVPITHRLHKWHVIPVGDIRPHELRAECWCKPVEDADVDIGLGVALVHRAMDGREDYQNGVRGMH